MTRHFSNTRNVWTCVGGWCFGMSRVNVGWLSSTRNHNRGHTSVPPCYYEKDRVFIMSKNFVRYLSMLTWDVVWDVIMQFLSSSCTFFLWNKQIQTCLKTMMQKFKLVERMMQSNPCPTKLLHHYFQTVLNMFKIWCNQNKLLHHYF